MKTETIEKILNFLQNNEYKEIPKEWVNLKETNSLIKKFENHPNGVQYKHEGNLDLSGEQLTKLPNDLYVDGWLGLSNCPQLTKLPDKLYAGKTLSISKTNIKELPDNLYVGGNLFLIETSIEEIPNNLYVGRNLFIQNTPLSRKYTHEEIYEMITLRGGEIIGEIFR